MKQARAKGLRRAALLAMFAGGAVAGLAIAGASHALGLVPALPAPGAAWLVPVLAWATVLVLANWALQFGATRLPAGTTSLVMLSEILFATASSVLAGAASPTPATWTGGALIVLAALLAAVQRRK